eukprot:1262089-Rhodomonas_salina.3
MPSIVGLTDWLTDNERVGWRRGAYHKTLTDKHLVLLCRKYAADLEKLNPEWAKSLPPPGEAANSKEYGAASNSDQFGGVDGNASGEEDMKNNYRDEDEDPRGGGSELSEETH